MPKRSFVRALCGTILRVHLIQFRWCCSWLSKACCGKPFTYISIVVLAEKNKNSNEVLQHGALNRVFTCRFIANSIERKSRQTLTTAFFRPKKEKESEAAAIIIIMHRVGKCRSAQVDFLFKELLPRKLYVPFHHHLFLREIQTHNRFISISSE